MKLLIGAVVALLCMQTIKASSVEGRQCKNAVKKQNAAINKWFKNYKCIHDDAHKYLNNIVITCSELSEKLLLISNATTLSECDIRQFVDRVYTQYLEATYNATQLEYFIRLLIFKSDEHKCEETDFSGSKCKDVEETEAKLFTFHCQLDVLGEETGNLTAGLLQDCFGLYQLLRKFDCENGPCCNGKGCSCGKGLNAAVIVENFKKFLAKFKELHDCAHAKLQKIWNDCVLLTSGIDDWIEETEN